jgi:cobalt-zinc-cadmium efflux system membrane fusion protein
LREAESSFALTRQRESSFRGKLQTIGLTAEQVDAILTKRTLVEAVPVRAPINGTVVRFQATLGQAVKTDHPLFEIHDLSGASLRVHVPEQLVSMVRIGQRGRVRFVAASGLMGEAILVRSGQTVGDAQHSLTAWADLTGGARTPLLLGMMARVTLVTSESPPILAVPVEAVLHDGTAAYLFVKRPDGTFARRSVETGRGDDNFVEVSAGLTEGEEVAVHGVTGLQIGYAALR